MRTTLVFVALLTSSIAIAETRALSNDEIREHVKGADAAIGECYLGVVGERAGVGRLEITLTIHRKGIVDAIDVKTPGLTAKQNSKIDTCVRAALDGISFPSRRAGTTALVPYFYQRTPGSQPIESCWNAKGCPEQKDETVVTQPKKTKALQTNRQARRAPRG